MAKYYKAIYKDKNGTKSSGYWKDNEKDLKSEIERMEKVPHMKYEHVETLELPQDHVKQVAKESGITVAEALSCI